MTAPRLAVIGVVIVALFLAAVNLGIGRDGDHPAPGWVKNLQNVLSGSPPPLTTAAFSGGDCVQGGQLVVMGSCHLDIHASTRPSRVADLVLAQGTAARVTVSQPGTVESDFTLKPGDNQRLSVFKKGGSLDVACPGLAACVIDLAKAQS